MKLYRVILLILLFIRAIGTGYATNYDKKIYHLEENEKFYYVNVWGERLTESIYDCYYGSGGEDWIIVCRNDMYGVLNAKGIEIIPCQYKRIEPIHRLDKNNRYIFPTNDKILFVVENKETYGVLNVKGKIVIPFSYKEISAQLFGNESLIFRRNDGKYGAINVYTSQVTIPFKYDSCWLEDCYPSDLNNRNKFFLLGVRIGNKKGFIGCNGNIIIPLSHSSTDYGFNEGHIALKNTTSNQWYIYDKYGEKTLIGDYEDVGRCSDEMLKVKRNGLYGFVDVKSGKLVIPCIYDEIRDDFEHGIAKVYSKEKKYMLISKEGKFIYETGIMPTYVGDNYIITGYPKGMLDKKGNILIPFIYKGLWNVETNGYLRCENTEGKYGIIDSRNNVIIPFKYDNISSYYNGKTELIPVKRNGRWGYINHSNKVIIPFNFDMAEPFDKGDDVAFVIQNGKYGYIDRTGKEIMPFGLQGDCEWLLDNYKASNEPSDVDKSIPFNDITNDKTFVVIISNEKYIDENIPNVSYSSNDGKSVKEYCVRTLGVPLKNIKFLENATFNQIHTGINWVCDNAKAFDGEANIIIYYSGHGCPNEKTGNAYLLPIDGSFKDYRTAISIDDIYKQLGEINTKQTTVFLDACFSGTSRDGKNMLADARGVVIKTKPAQPTGNTIVFSAAQGDETAHPYKKKKHGIFTYFLLKKIQETKGHVSLGELGTYVNQQVRQHSIMEVGKSQSPTINVSNKLGTNWKILTLK